jgi:hypothetical protein
MTRNTSFHEQQTGPAAVRAGRFQNSRVRLAVDQKVRREGTDSDPSGVRFRPLRPPVDPNQAGHLLSRAVLRDKDSPHADAEAGGDTIKEPIQVPVSVTGNPVLCSAAHQARDHREALAQPAPAVLETAFDRCRARSSREAKGSTNAPKTPHAITQRTTPKPRRAFKPSSLDQGRSADAARRAPPPAAARSCLRPARHGP